MTLNPGNVVAINPMDCLFAYPPAHALGVDGSVQYASINGLKLWFDATSAPYGIGTYKVQFSSSSQDALAHNPSFLLFPPASEYRAWNAPELVGVRWAELSSLSDDQMDCGR